MSLYELINDIGRPPGTIGAGDVLPAFVTLPGEPVSHVERTGSDTRAGSVSRQAPPQVGVALQVLTRYIPVEVIAAYIAIVSIISNPSDELSFVTFFSLWILTPTLVILGGLSIIVGSHQPIRTLRSMRSIWRILAPTIAFPIYVSALPASAISAHWPNLSSRVGGVAAVLTAIFVPSIGELVDRLSSRRRDTPM